MNGRSRSFVCIGAKDRGASVRSVVSRRIVFIALDGRLDSSLANVSV